MKVVIQEKTDTYLRIQVKDDSHTVYNILKETILEDPNVKLCGYAKDEAFSDSIVFQIQTEEGVSPVDMILESVQRLKGKNKQFIDAFNDVYKPD